MDKNLEKEIVERLKRGDRKAQKFIFDRYSSLFLGVAIRYAGSKEAAEDILQEAFLKIFTNIKSFKGTGSFEGWMRRIVINTAIIHYHKETKHKFHKDFDEIQEIDIEGDVSYEIDNAEFTMEELLEVIKSLPKGYRTIFNLYAIEGYKHKEIAKMLGIDESTSKSQYHRAKKLLQKKLNALKKMKNEK